MEKKRSALNLVMTEEPIYIFVLMNSNGSDFFLYL